VANGVVSAEERYPCWNPVLFQPKSGPLLLFYKASSRKAGPGPSHWLGRLITSVDGGRSWSAPRSLPAGIIGPVNDGQEIAAIQPSILVHPQGRLQAIGRTGQGRIFEIWSADGGKTWGRMSLTDLPNPNSGTDALTLADGRHLLVYNHSGLIMGKWSGHRSPLNVAISADGREWQAALVLENEAGEFSYPAVIQTADRLVHITYSWKRKSIKHVVLDPAKLVLRLMPGGQWPK
jgi:predicted neuraminidase